MGSQDWRNRKRLATAPIHEKPHEPLWSQCASLRRGSRNWPGDGKLDSVARSKYYSDRSKRGGAFGCAGRVAGPLLNGTRRSVTDRAFIGSAIERSVQRFGAIHGLVNNAGITRTAMIENMTSEEWQAVIDVNLTGAFNVLQTGGGK